MIATQESATGCGCGSTPKTTTTPPPAGSACGLPREPSPAAGPSTGKRLDIELLYLDLDVCTRCRDTDTRLEEALADVARVLEAAGIEVELRKTHIESLEMARDLRFASSPTIRVNGRDIQMAVRENPCGSCSALSGTEVECRVWSYEGEEFPAPPKAMIVESLLKEVYGAPAPETEERPYELPENIRRFFAGREAAPEAGPTAPACGL